MYRIMNLIAALSCVWFFSASAFAAKVAVDGEQARLIFDALAVRSEIAGTSLSTVEMKIVGGLFCSKSLYQSDIWGGPATVTYYCELSDELDKAKPEAPINPRKSKKSKACKTENYPSVKCPIF